MRSTWAMDLPESPAPEAKSTCRDCWITLTSCRFRLRQIAAGLFPYAARPDQLRIHAIGDVRKDPEVATTTFRNRFQREAL